MAIQAESLPKIRPVPRVPTPGDISNRLCDVRDYLRALDALALHGNNGGIAMTGDQFSMLLKPLEGWVDAAMDDLRQLSHQPR